MMQSVQWPLSRLGELSAIQDWPTKGDLIDATDARNDEATSVYLPPVSQHAG